MCGLWSHGRPPPLAAGGPGCSRARCPGRPSPGPGFSLALPCWDFEQMPPGLLLGRLCWAGRSHARLSALVCGPQRAGVRPSHLRLRAAGVPQQEERVAAGCVLREEPRHQVRGGAPGRAGPPPLRAHGASDPGGGRAEHNPHVPRGGQGPPSAIWFSAVRGGGFCGPGGPSVAPSVIGSSLLCS